MSVLRRLKIAFSYYKRPLSLILPWLIKSREDTNFTYELSALNLSYLASFVAMLTKGSDEIISGYIQEALRDEALKRHIKERSQSIKAPADAEAKYGRRLGWYAIVRSLKPAIVIETGVDKGLGTCLIAAALLKNAEEGHPGRIYGIDINADSGYLLGGPYSDFAEIIIGDAVESLSKFSKPIDCYINDSNHSPTYERTEYETIRDKLSPKAILIGDNAHCSEELRNFALRTGRNFLFFREEPKDHWYPGAGIGVAFPK
jgi:predicted O-methyltransferase YrrM